MTKPIEGQIRDFIDVLDDQRYDAATMIEETVEVFASTVLTYRERLRLAWRLVTGR